ncbi:MAG: hypothetical protein AAF191_02910 [Verrucomicrobiota bacterium]
MKALLLCGFALLGSAFASANQPVLWNPSVISGDATVTWIGTEEARFLRISSSSDSPSVIRLSVIPEPGVQSLFYGIDGHVRYEGVSDTSFLEMWSHYPNPEDEEKPLTYFSRTLANRGVLKNIQGDSPWRFFRLPFHRSSSSSPPQKLIINLHLKGPGIVELREQAHLNEFPHYRTMLSVPGEWWSGTFGNSLGAVLGSFIGIWGGLIGLLSGRGKARSFVMTSLLLFLILGGIFLLTGLLAVLVKQPYHVYYPLLLMGAILVPVSLSSRNSTRKRYQAQEQGKMDALDAVT